jgi:hypothetical protein
MKTILLSVFSQFAGTVINPTILAIQGIAKSCIEVKK